MSSKVLGRRGPYDHDVIKKPKCSGYNMSANMNDFHPVHVKASG